MLIQVLIACLWLTQLIGLSSALTHDHHHIKRQSGGPVYIGFKVPSYNISIPVDHFNASDTRTYNNRFWVNDTFYKPGGPVFFYDNGEVGISSQLAAQVLAEVNYTSGIMKLAEQYHGIAVLWEHRYYGLSLPIPLNLSTYEPEGGLKSYQYLTVDQALEDVVYFANNWQPNGCIGEACTALQPSKTPWVWIGGSYPGIRGALIRIRNPETIHAVWSSSAPVQSMYDGSPYYNQIIATLPSNCSEDVRAVIKLADETMDGQCGPEAFRNLQNLAYVSQMTQAGLNTSYNLSLAARYSRSTIGRELLTMFVGDFLYSTAKNSTDVFCSYLGAYNPEAAALNTTNEYVSILTNPATRPVSSASLTSTYNSTVALEAYFYAGRRWGEGYQVRYRERTKWSELSPSVFADINSWSYQVLTQFGWFPGSNPNNITYISKYWNTTVTRESLMGTFFDDTKQFPPRPDSNAFNKYGGWNMTPSNVMFTDGEFDPWRAGSVLSNQSYIGAPIRRTTETVPACNQPPNGSDVFGIVFPGAAHVPDQIQDSWITYDNSSAVYQGVKLFSKALDTWLPCFYSSKANHKK